MLKNLNLENVLFLDIETVPQYSCYEALPEKMKKLWDEKASRLKYPDKSDTTEELYLRAGGFMQNLAE